MTTAVLVAFFTLWARQLGCPDVVMLAPRDIFMDPWVAHIESADACGHILQQVDSVYLPHGDTLAHTFLLDGERAYDAPSLYVVIGNLVPETPDD